MAATKADRERAAAARRGLTVEELRAERRIKAAEDRELARQAQALGIATRELRLRLGQEVGNRDGSEAPSS